MRDWASRSRLHSHCVNSTEGETVELLHFFERFNMLIQFKIYGIFMVDRASPEYVIWAVHIIS